MGSSFTCGFEASSVSSSYPPADVVRLLSIAFGTERISTSSDCAEIVMLNEHELHALHTDSDLTYGELLPEGVSKALNYDYLAARNSETKLLLELGMGFGKAALQAFLECPNILRVVGIEMVPSRYEVANAALNQLAHYKPERFRFEQIDCTRASLFDGQRRFDIHLGDLFDIATVDLQNADVVLLEFAVPPSLQTKLQTFLCKLRNGCRAFLYDDLSLTWCIDSPCHWHRISSNAAKRDLFATSWRPEEGSHFFCGIVDGNRPPSVTIQSASEARRKIELEWDLAPGDFFKFYQHLHEIFANTNAKYRM